MKALTEKQRDSIQFRLDFKLFCRDKAIERCDYDMANIFQAQAAYFHRLLAEEPLTDQNRNEA